MSTKHVFDDATGLVEKACRGVASTNSNLRFYAPHKVLYNAAHPRDKVAIIAGGGAGSKVQQLGQMLTQAANSLS
mgnify:CR=1 FL=1